MEKLDTQELGQEQRFIPTTVMVGVKNTDIFEYLILSTEKQN